VFHVSTFLPYIKNDDQQLARKSRIGNGKELLCGGTDIWGVDLGVIVFQDGNCSYTTPIASQFLRILFIVTPWVLPLTDRCLYICITT
jgi:hypothetical protein